MLNRREFGLLVAASMIRTRQQTPTTPLLDIADWSYHFYGVAHAKL